MSKARLSVAAALAAIAAVNAAEITVEQAGIAVQRWLDENPALVSMNGASVASAETINTTTGSRLHVVKLADGGFAVTSADDRVDPVLVFVRDGDELIQDEANPLWALLSGDIAARERAAGVSAPAKGGSLLRAASVPDCAARAQARWAALLAGSTSGGKPLPVLKASAGLSSLPDTRVASFVDSRWNQSTHNNYTNGKKCYNYYTPSNYVCGCVATAGGQIMRYWQWPQTSVTPQTKECSVDGTNVYYTMKGGTYDWSSMPLVPASGVTDAQCQAIGKLTYDVGVSVCMDWASDGSGANMFALTKRLKDTFGFANAEAAVYMNGTYPYTLDNVKKAVIPNCNARAPLAMSVTGMSDGYVVGHAVLVDGYGYSGSDFYIHVNLGWGGYNDAWYMPPDIEDFSAIDGFILNIFPEKTGSIISGRVLDASGAPIANASVTLKHNTTTDGTTTSDANGIYAFIAYAPCSYQVSATSGGVSATISVSLAKTTGTSLADDGGWYNTAASIGNTFDSDIALTGVASVALPVFSPDSCLFYPSTNVVITCADAGDVIRYTTDGSDPDASSAVYTGPIFVDDDVTIKARAFEDGKNPSPVVGAVYTYDFAQGAPKGDYFDNPIVISGANGSRVIEDNSAYTVEDGEPRHTRRPSGSGGYTYNSQYRTAWYLWTAPGSGTMTLQTQCSGGGYVYPTYIAVYIGDTLSLNNRQAFAYEYDKTTYVTALEFDVEQGVTYRIAGMMGYDGSGTFTLSWSGDLTVMPTETSTTEIPVTYVWLDEYFPGGASATNDYETIANSDADGDGLATWAEFLLGTDPTNALSRLEATIRMDGMTPIVESNADTNRLATFGYQPAVKGKQTLDATAEWAATNSSHRFFKVFVEKRGP